MWYFILILFYKFSSSVLFLFLSILLFFKWIAIYYSVSFYAENGCICTQLFSLGKYLNYCVYTEYLSTNRTQHFKCFKTMCFVLYADFYSRYYLSDKKIYIQIRKTLLLSLLTVHMVRLILSSSTNHIHVLTLVNALFQGKVLLSMSHIVLIKSVKALTTYQSLSYK